ncbi:MAG TPA: hypothetical protein VFG37_04245, partial [Planctomycetota bacterium]|nr:hypothetical protein [Planctomycetota bacterium]
MNRFRACLWKEWREHRGVAVAIAIASFLLVLLFELAAPRRAHQREDDAGIAALLTFAVVSLAFFGEAFAGEERRGTLDFLRRQPGGWGPPFAAKYVFLLAASVALTAWAWWCGAAATWWIHGVASVLTRKVGFERLVEGVALIPLWSIAVSIWFPRGTLALPGAVFVFALFLAPVAAACFWARSGEVLRNSEYDALVCALGVLRIPDEAFGWMLRAAVVAAPLVALLSFARGRAVERGPWRAGAIGLVALLVLFVPGYAWTATRAVDYRRFDPAAAGLCLDGSEAWLAPSGRFAYLNANTVATSSTLGTGFWRTELHGPTHPLRIDLESGAWSELGGIGARVIAVPGVSTSSSSTPYVVIEDLAAPPRPPPHAPLRARPWLSGPVPLPLLDAETGARIRDDVDEAFLSARDDEGARLQQFGGAVVLPDGGRAWVERGHVVRRDASGATRVLPDSASAADFAWIGASTVRGLGLVLGKDAAYDVLGERRVELPASRWLCWIRRGECIVVESGGPIEGSDRKAALRMPWSRWNCETRTIAPIVGLKSDEHSFEAPCEMADDGRLFVTRRVAAPVAAAAELWLLDPATGEREPVALPEALRDWRSANVQRRARTPSGAAVVSIADARWHRVVFARFD